MSVKHDKCQIHICLINCRFNAYEEKKKQGKAIESNGGCRFRKEGREGLLGKMIFEQGSGQNRDGGGEQDIWLLGKTVPGKRNRRYKVLEIGMLKGY